MPTDDRLRPAGVVFDCDGTLVDTESISDAALAEVLDGFGHELTDPLRAELLGRPWAHNWTVLHQRLGLTDEIAFRDAYRSAFVDRFASDVVLFEDAVATARHLAESGLPLAVATSSSRRHLEAVLDLGLRELFSATVAADDTDEHKPAPAPYLLASRLLGVRPDRAVAVEDSPVGVAAARAAGMVVVGVARPGTEVAALSEAHRVVTWLDPAAVRLDGASAA